MSVLIIRVAMTTHVFRSTPVAFVVVQGDEEPGDKTPQASIGATALTQNGSRQALLSSDEFLGDSITTWDYTGYYKLFDANLQFQSNKKECPCQRTDMMS